MSNGSPASLFAPNCPSLQAWSLSTAFPCRPGASQLPSPAGHLVVAIFCPHRSRIFDHMGAAILCVGVMVNLHITLLLDRIEAWYMGDVQLVCPEGYPESGWGFPWGVGLPEQGASGGLQAGHTPWRPKQRPWYLEFIYLLQLKLCSLERSHASCSLYSQQPFLFGFVYLL